MNWIKNFAVKYPRLTVVLVLLTLALVAYAVMAYRKNRDARNQQKSLNELDVNKGALTITDNQATIISENLLGAMNKYGTDEKTIVEILKTLRKDDLTLVIQKFGVRPYNGAGLATRDYEKKFFATDLNLIGWLKQELDGDDLNEVANIFLNNQIPF